MRSGLRLRRAWWMVIACAATGSAFAQLRIVDYNTANSSVLPRPGMSTILDAIGTESINGIARDIDVLCLQEQANVSTTTQAMVNLMNQVTGTTNYARGLVNAGTTGAGRVGVVYNSTTVQLIAEQQYTFTGSARSTMRYQFRPIGYDESADFFVYVDHYKAGSTSTDQQRREDQATALRATADALGEGANVLYTGDFNIQSASEDMYDARLMGPGAGQAFDPINVFATWHDNNALRSTHTQSPTTDDPVLTTGGIDDRFDFQLVTGEVRDGEGFSYIGPGVGDISVGQHSYHAFGNNGTHVMNGPINTPANTAQPMTVLNALESVSDHLPVVADYQLPAKMGVLVDAVAPRVIQGASVSVDVTVSNVAPVSVALGADELDFNIAGAGAVLGSADGVDAALGGGELRSLTLDTSAIGSASGQVHVTSDSQSVANGDFNQAIAYDVLASSEGSFADGGNVDSLTLDFGRRFQSVDPYSLGFDLYNLESAPGFTAALDLDSAIGSGDVARLFTDFAPQSILAGDSAALVAMLDSSVIGDFAAAWTFQVSDEDLPGAAAGDSLLLELLGQILLYGDFNASGALDGGDIDDLFAALGGLDLFYDLTGDGIVDSLDVDLLVRDIFHTEYGDANLDGMVDGADFTVWGDAFGVTPAGWSQGDFNGDGAASGADFTLWADHFGFVAPLAPVPEPSTWALAGLGLAALAALRRRAR